MKRFKLFNRYIVLTLIFLFCFRSSWFKKFIAFSAFLVFFEFFEFSWEFKDLCFEFSEILRNTLNEGGKTITTLFLYSCIYFISKFLLQWINLSRGFLEHKLLLYLNVHFKLKKNPCFKTLEEKVKKIFVSGKFQKID
jgi:hypothetical protein